MTESTSDKPEGLDPRSLYPENVGKKNPPETDTEGAADPKSLYPEAEPDGAADPKSLYPEAEAGS